MRKKLPISSRVFLVFCISFFLFLGKVYPQAAPEKYEGVMLQAFFWDSFKETKWTALESQADELAASFDLLWLPPSGNDLMGHMGYHPVYYFNQNSSFGTQAELKSLIATLKSKGVGSIADIVVNHRNGVSTWTNFPAETYKGVTYTWGPEAICKDDEVASQASQAKPTGAYDTGEGWSGARDIDHTNENVRNTIKAYLDFMKNEMGYSGWRYDVAKGFAAKYMGEYSKSAGLDFSVGEYWDGNFDALAGYIDGTKIDNQIRTGAFDFSLKYLLNEACNSGKWDKLCWKRNGTLNQPAGLIHSDGFARFAYTFVDNHDTWRPGTSAHDGAVKDNVLAANAFILTQPGIPCVFYPHWRDYKAAIKPMIEARKLVGVHSQSEVRVLETASDIYAAEVVGKRGSLIVKVGPRYTFNVPAGYTIKCAGQNYAIWTKVTSEPIAKPEMQISPATGTYTNKVQATLTASGINSPISIYYTIDGTEPTTASSKVSTGFVLDITENTTIKAISVDSKGNSSVVISNTYTIKKETQSRIVIKWDNAQNWSGDMYIYAWDATAPLAGVWPGTKVVAGADGKYTFEVNAAMTNVIFNNKMQQTADITNVLSDACYTISSDKNAKGQNIAIATNCSSVSNSFDVRWTNTQNWSGDMYIYVWNATGPLAGVWPGTRVLPGVDGKYTYTAKSAPVNIIFTNGVSQTVDIQNVSSTVCYTISDQKTGSKFNIQATDCNVLKSTIGSDIDQQNVLIYPNPVVDVLNIQSELDIDQALIITTNGATVLDTRNVKNTLNVGHLPNGLYFVVLKTSDGSKYIHRLMKK